jgi:tryptophan-rich sensory protein
MSLLQCAGFVAVPVVLGDVLHRFTFDAKAYEEKLATGVTFPSTQLLRLFNTVCYACIGFGTSLAFESKGFADNTRLQIVLVLQLLLMWAWNVLFLRGITAACVASVVNWIVSALFTWLLREVSKFAGNVALPVFAWSTFILNMTFELKDYYQNPAAFTAPKPTQQPAPPPKPTRPLAPPGYDGPKRKDGTPLYREYNKDD